MCEALLSAPCLATPQLYTLCVHGCEICSLRRPLHERLRPTFTVNNLLWLILFLIPEHSNLLSTVHDHLVSAINVTQPGPQMFLLLERLNFRRAVFLIDAAFTSVTVDIGQFVYGHGMFLVERNSVKLLDSGNSLARLIVFNKSITRILLEIGFHGAHFETGIVHTPRSCRHHLPA